MGGLDRDALDRYITGGRYSRSLILVTCPACETQTPVEVETEYGVTTWNPVECRKCGREFTGQEEWEDDEPDPDRLAEEI